MEIKLEKAFNTKNQGHDLKVNFDSGTLDLTKNKSCYVVLDLKDKSLFLGVGIWHSIYFGFLLKENEPANNEYKLNEFEIHLKQQGFIQDDPKWLGYKYVTPTLDFSTFDSEEIFGLVDKRDTIIIGIVKNIKREVDEHLKFVKS